MVLESDLNVELGVVEVFELFARVTLQRALYEAVGTVEHSQVVHRHLLLLAHVLQQQLCSLPQQVCPPGLHTKEYTVQMTIKTVWYGRTWKLGILREWNR